MIEYDFQYIELLKLLSKRGRLIKKQKQSQRKEVEKQIMTYIETHQEKLSRPEHAFVTFEHSDTVNHMLAIKDPEHFTVKGHAPLPSDIKWNSRNKISAHQKFKSFLTHILIALVLLSLMTIIIVIRYYSQMLVTPFHQIRCRKFYPTFKSDLPFYAQKEYLNADYNIETLTYRLLNEETDLYSMQLTCCYCAALQPNNAQFQMLNIQLKEVDLEMIAQSDPTGRNGKECSALAEYIQIISYFKMGVDKSTVVVNILLKILCVWLVKQLNFANQSQETKRIMILVFIIQFFNTGLIQLLVHGDFSQLGFSFLSFINAGYHPDFTVRWYKDVGYMIIDAMTTNIYAPIVELIIALATSFIYRTLDRGSLKDTTFKTKKTSLESFISLYGGPQYYLHSKYSNLLNIVYMTFMFGMGLPILFPIAFASFLVIYILERFLVAYYYRQPELTDHELSATVLRLLAIAPLLYLSFGFWMMGNIQIFFNNVIYTKQ